MGCAGTANKSGWMNDSSMELYMKHFVQFVRPCKERPALLLLDNHSSHMSINALNIAKENHIHFLSFPAHCSHRLQPLDVSVYGPMKKFNSSAASAWMVNNPGKTMSIYDIPGIVSKSYPLAANPINITAGFRQAGIVPFDREGFHSKADYDPGFVTDRMDPTVSLVEIEMPPLDEPFFIPMDIFPDQNELFVEAEVENIAEEPQVQENSDKETGGSQQSLQSATPISSPTSSCSSAPSIGILEELRPFPKAGPRTAPKNNGRRKRTSAVLTDTPVKSVIEAEKAAVITKAARKVFPPEKSSKSEKTQSPKKPREQNERRRK
jgi:DDE superfamily endonuclease